MAGHREDARLPARRRADRNPRLRRRRLPGRVRAPRRPAHRRPVRGAGGAAHRLPRLLSERVRAPGPRGDVHPPQRRGGAPRLARLRGVQAERAPRGGPGFGPAGGDAGHPGLRRDGRDDRARAKLGRGAARRTAAARVPIRPRRPRRRHQVRRLRRTERGHDQPGGRTRLRSARRRGRDGHVRGDLRAHRLRGAHGVARRHPGARRRGPGRGGKGAGATTRTSVTGASEAATSSTVSRPSRRSPSGRTRRAGPGRSRGSSSPGCVPRAPDSI